MMALVSLSSLIVPTSSSYENWIPLILLVGWLALLGFLGLVVLVIYLLMRNRQSDQGQATKPLREIGMFFLYLVQFFSTWTMLISLGWFLIVVYLALVTPPYRIMSSDLLSQEPYLWHLGLSYFFFLISFPVSGLICLKTWGAIKTSLGIEKKRLLTWKKVYYLVQLFFSSVLFLIFTGLSAFVFLVILIEDTSYVDWTYFALLGIPLLPAAVSFLAGIWYLVGLVALAKEGKDGNERN